MILVDANLLIYQHVASLPQHDAARTWLDDRLNDTAPVGLPWPSLLAFLRIVTNPRAFEQPASITDAWRQVVAWLACDPVWIPSPGNRHSDVLSVLLRVPSLRANPIPDAHLAALAIEHGLILFSADRDFARFPGLQWENPLTS